MLWVSVLNSIVFDRTWTHVNKQDLLVICFMSGWSNVNIMALSACYINWNIHTYIHTYIHIYICISLKLASWKICFSTHHVVERKGTASIATDSQAPMWVFKQTRQCSSKLSDCCLVLWHDSRFGCERSWARSGARGGAFWRTCTSEGSFVEERWELWALGWLFWCGEGWSQPAPVRIRTQALRTYLSFWKWQNLFLLERFSNPL